MARGFVINGETMVGVKGNQNSAIAVLTQLGLSVDQISCQPEFFHDDVQVNAWGGRAPADEQAFLAAYRISMTLVHWDPVVLDECIRLSMGGAPIIGTTPRAGTLLGGGTARFATGNYYIGLNLTSPVLLKPYRFYYAYLAGTPVTLPLGTERSLVQLNWRAIPYAADPWNGGLGAFGSVIWDNVLDT